MSVVKIVSHNENVYSLKEKDKVETIKPPRYNSIYREMVRDEEKTRKNNCGHKTFGYPEVLLNPPDEFLKKYARNSRTTGNRRDHHHHHYVHLKAALPHEYALILHQNINHISKNVSEVTKNAVARRRPTSSCFVDSKRGDFFDLEKSGLMPKYVFQDKFGKTPNYIQKRKDSANKLKMQKETEAELHSSRIRIISERERNEILMVNIEI